jgi:hypothetical protein
LQLRNVGDEFGLPADRFAELSFANRLGAQLPSVGVASCAQRMGREVHKCTIREAKAIG